MSIGILSSNQNGTNQVCLDTLGYGTSPPVYSTAWGTGCLNARWTHSLPPFFDHPAIRLGRLITIVDGALPVWRGILNDPQLPPSSGGPWQLNADGLASLADKYVAVDGSNNPTTNPNTAIDAAVTRGLPWSRAETLPTPTLPTVTPGKLSDLLNQVTTATGRRWGVFAGSHVTMPTDPSTPAYVSVAADTPGGRTLDGYATTVWAVYQDATSSTNKLTSVGSGTTPWGVYEDLQDLTGLGPMSAANAQAILAGMLTLENARAFFTGTLTVSHGQLLTLGGGPVALSTVRAGQMVQFRGVALDPTLGELTPSSVVNVLIGQTSYDAASDTLQLAPVNTTPTDLTSYLARYQRTA